MRGWIVAAGAASALALLVWLLTSSGTDPRLLRPHPLRWWFRFWRSSAARAAAALAGWPHVAEVALRTHASEPCASQSREIWARGPFRLLRYESTPVRREPVLVVHALVTRHWILDLEGPDASLVRALLADGHDVFLLDWGTPGREDAGLGLPEYCAAVLEAEEVVRATAGASRVHLVGYCSGATALLARLGRWPAESVASVSLIAPLVDAEVPGGMGTILGHRAFKPVVALDHRNLVPAGLVRESFHFLRPQAMRSVLGLLKHRGDADFRARYDPLSRWAWSHRPVPGKLLFDMTELFRGNTLVRGSLEIDGEKVDLSRVRAPVLLLLANRDHIVPAGSGLALTALPALPLEVVHCPSGHVSMLTGGGSKAVLRPALLRWLADHTMDEPAPAKRSRKKAGARK